MRPQEVAALLWSWLYVFSVLSAYYVIRPIRDEMGVQGGVENLQWLFTGTLLAMLAVNPPFAALVQRLPRQRFIAIAYRFFMLNLLVFVVLLQVGRGGQHVWVGRVFFIWVVGVQPVRGLGVLGADGRHLRLRAGQAAVRLHRGGRQRRRHRRLERHRVAVAKHDRRDLAAARLGALLLRSRC